ncbi:MAG: alpha-amylase family glycosyl hydrolase [Nitrospirales bacterium]
MKSRSSAFSFRPHPHLFELNTWVWLSELSLKRNRTLRLADVPDREWDDLQAKGFDGVWLMGIWERSPRSRQIARAYPDLQKEYAQALPDWQPADVVGSPYSIRAYRPDPELASWEQLEEVKEKLHDRGMKLILDFVPNHTALDHEWVVHHPEYYIQGASTEAMNYPSEFFSVETSEGIRYLAHGKDPHSSPWTDTAQLNFFHPHTRQALLHELQNMADCCDGVRCDMAMLVLNEVFGQTWKNQVTGLESPNKEFWSEAIALLPGFIWMAEVYWEREWELQQLGFHYTYDRRLYQRLRFSSPHEVALHLQANLDYQCRSVRFMENHDEERAMVVFGAKKHEAVSLVMATIPGMRFYHQGQLEGRRLRIPVQLARASLEMPDRDVQQWYERLLSITNEEVFHLGRWRIVSILSSVDSSCEPLIAYQWKLGTKRALVVVNLSALPAGGTVFLDDEVSKHDQPVSTDFITVQELFTNAESKWKQGELSQQGLPVQVPPHEGRIFFMVQDAEDRSGDVREDVR